MCGITGIISRKEDLHPTLIKSMTGALEHRGPDDEGYLAVDWTGGHVTPLTGPISQSPDLRIEQFHRQAGMFLGHRRLSILDLSPAGHQPMSDPEKIIWIIYNGEIYNYLEIREELLALGHRFQTSTDTEVILAAYRQWGRECVHKFNGMWAFVIYDSRQKIIFGSRDRYGVKPLYYFSDTSHFAFASEIKALLTLPFVKREINDSQVHGYLKWEKESGEETFFKNIFEIPPACSFSFDLRSGVFQKWRYYQIQFNPDWEDFDQARFCRHSQKTEELIFNAVRLRLRSDVPVGSCLSGGLDSSAIVCSINHLLKRQHYAQLGPSQKTFTAIYPGFECDESQWAKIVVNSTRTSWYTTTPTSQGLLQDLEDFVYTQDTPCGSTSIYAQYCIMRLAKEHGVKVLLDGQGGDELFAGYTPHYQFFFNEILKNRAVRCYLNELKFLANSPLNGGYLFKALQDLLLGRGLPSYGINVFNKLTNSQKFLSQDFLKAYPSAQGYAIVPSECGGLLNAALKAYLENSLPNLLKYEDRNSMRFSLEARTPLADDAPLIDYTFQVPSVYKIHNGWNKYLFRKCLAGILPPAIQRRKDKIGFATPEYFWLKDINGHLKGYITRKLTPYVNVELLLQKWDTVFHDPLSLKTANIWRIINLAAWMKIYSL
ncbi:MAG: asparagine synthase (glutamine-hydrolyzing) [Candidatus Omnitrophota bacterium]|nr:asparagine synthase (glutamine-hydrolyzing) [Candidatus Omnitrophota bacterium]